MKIQCYPLKRGLTTVIKLHFFLQISAKMLLWEIYGVESGEQACLLPIKIILMQKTLQMCNDT